MIPIRYNLRSLLVRKGTSAAAAGGIALVALVLSASLMMGASVEKTLAGGGRDDVAVIVRSGSSAELNSTFSASDADVVRATAGEVPASSEVVVVAALPKVGAEGFGNVTLRGLGDEGVKLRPRFALTEGRMPAPGADEALVGARVRGRFAHLNVGDALELRRGRPVKIVGVFEDAGDASESEVWLDRELLRAAFGRAGSVSSMRLQMGSAAALESLRASVESDKRLGLSVESERKFLEKQSEGLSSFLRVMGTMVAVLFSVAAMMGAVITMHGSIAGRTREIGALRALGFQGTSVFAGFLFEAAALALGGGIVGASAALLLGFVHVSMTNYATWSELSFGFAPTVGTYVAAVAFSAGMGLLSGIAPAIRAARITPLAALRS
jgi:putative ABC transport system permease protein